jgi:predicted DNA-binding transcriptional regulator AlpA
VNAALLHVEDVMAMFGVSRRTVHGWTMTRTVPCRRLAGTRRVFFLEDELRQWIDAGGSIELDVQEQPNGGLVVRPKAAA